MAGHTARRYRGRKRTFENQYLGPFLNHEMNRCITCYRCVRFYRDYAGGDDLAAFGSRDRMYFGRAADGVLENPFAGNLVEVCPTGVFTDKPASKSYTRKWDLQSAPSICPGCARRLQYVPGRTLRHVAADSQSLSPRPERLFSVRPRPLRRRVRQQRRAAQARRIALRGRQLRRHRAGRRDGAIRCVAAAGSGRWHRLAARVGGSELRAAHAGRRRQLLRGFCASTKKRSSPTRSRCCARRPMRARRSRRSNRPTRC